MSSREPEFDLLVVGGGINGAGIARDAAGRGLSVSADGRHALTTRVVPPISDLLLLETSK